MKHLAVFVEELKEEYSYDMVQEIIEISKQQNIILDIFQNFNVYGSNILFGYGEKELIYIPDLKNYDGICFLSDTVSLGGYEDVVLAIAKTVPEVPLISVRKEIDGAYNVLIDDYSAMFEMVEHFITKHGLTKIAFMKGRWDLKDAQVRFQAYEDVMKKYGLPIKERYLFEGNYWTNMGVPAIDWFLGGDEIPEAIVCANDYMAFSLIDELEKRGYKVPEDIAISGYDNLKMSNFITPSLTTAGVSFSKLAKGTIEMFKNIWNGTCKEKNVYVPSVCYFKESCGCNNYNYLEYKKYMYQEKKSLDNAITQATFLYHNLDNAKSMKDLLLTIPIHLACLEYNGQICLCLNSKSEATQNSNPFTDTMILKGIIDRNGVTFCDTPFARKKVAPDVLRNNNSIIVVNLHRKDDSFGYLILNEFPNKDMTNFLQFFVQGIINWYDKHIILEQNTKLAKESKLDNLTKIPSRKMINEHLNKTYQNFLQNGKGFFICSIDMDGLKQINDNHGHLMGDKAICSVANIIYNTSKSLGLAARIGGDEFMVCYNTENESDVVRNIQQMREKIAKHNETNDDPYELSISIGYYKCASRMMLSHYIEEADKLMYEEKRSKKKNRDYKGE